MSTCAKFTGRYQILHNNNKSTTDVDLNFKIDNAVAVSSAYFSLNPGESKEHIIVEQANTMLVESDNPVSVATANSDAGTATFTVDTLSDVASTSAKEVCAYTTQPLTLTTTDTLPAPLAINTTYYAISRGTNELMIAASSNDALAGTQIDITDTGTGVHTMVLDSLYSKRLDDSTHGTIQYWANANAEKVTIKNTGNARATGYFYSARTSA